MRYFPNPYRDYEGQSFSVDTTKIHHLIEGYVKKILENKHFADGDLYVGVSGIAFMFWKLHQSQAVESLASSSIQHAKMFVEHSKNFIGKKSEDSVSFLCGNSGIYAVSSIVNQTIGDQVTAQHDLNQFLSGFPVCQKLNFNRHGCDEILFGRAGYLSGIYWLNQLLPASQKINYDIITKICDVTIENGVQYVHQHKIRKLPLMWECYGDKYLGAAHGITAILHMLLESPLFHGNIQQLNSKQQLVKNTIDLFLDMQSADGNFPTVLKDAGNPEHKLVHWCHGAPGAVYLFAKAYLIFNEPKYLECCIKCGDLIWQRGLLKKGPSICHGVAGNGYVFLILYRLTNDPKHIYRASKFADFLTSERFLREARTPDRPLSLYEGVAGTICFLIDLLHPEKAQFPFMDVFDVKY